MVEVVTVSIHHALSRFVWHARTIARISKGVSDVSTRCFSSSSHIFYGNREKATSITKESFTFGPDYFARQHHGQIMSSAVIEPLDPLQLVENDLKEIFAGIRKVLVTDKDEFTALARYFFDGHGKSIRPSLVAMAARAVNEHVYPDQGILLKAQKDIAMIIEMVHTASLIHDDVIDVASLRRGKSTINTLMGNHRAVLVGNYIIARAIHKLTQTNNNTLVSYWSEQLMEMIRGELMQLQSTEGEDGRFSDYLRKSYLKTASLIAFGTKSAAMVVEEADEGLQECMYQYGRNIGIAFQLIDDLLDYSSSQHIGKPAAADLKLGLATAPVLFACDYFPELNDMIKRRFNQPGDVDKAYDFVQRSDGLEQTKFLAQKHASEALRSLEPLKFSPYKTALCRMVEILLNRTK